MDEAVKHRMTEDIQKDVLLSVKRIAEEEAARVEKIKEEEAAARSARKLALNNAWMNKSPPSEFLTFLQQKHVLLSISFTVSCI